MIAKSQTSEDNWIPASQGQGELADVAEVTIVRLWRVMPFLDFDGPWLILDPLAEA